MGYESVAATVTGPCSRFVRNTRELLASSGKISLDFAFGSTSQQGQGWSGSEPKLKRRNEDALHGDMTTRFGHYATNVTSTKVLSAMAKLKGEGMMVKATKDSEAGKMPSESSLQNGDAKNRTAETG